MNWIPLLEELEREKKKRNEFEEQPRLEIPYYYPVEDVEEEEEEKSTVIVIEL